VKRFQIVLFSWRETKSWSDCVNISHSHDYSESDSSLGTELFSTGWCWSLDYVFPGCLVTVQMRKLLLLVWSRLSLRTWCTHLYSIRHLHCSNKLIIPHGFIFATFMLASMLGSSLVSCLLTQSDFKVESYMQIVFLVVAVPLSSSAD
jgi:hypothetical protein